MFVRIFYVRTIVGTIVRFEVRHTCIVGQMDVLNGLAAVSSRSLK